MRVCALVSLLAHRDAEVVDFSAASTASASTLPLPLPPKCSYFSSSYPTHLFGSGRQKQPLPLPKPRFLYSVLCILSFSRPSHSRGCGKTLRHFHVFLRFPQLLVRMRNVDVVALRSSNGRLLRWRPDLRTRGFAEGRSNGFYGARGFPLRVTG